MESKVGNFSGVGHMYVTEDLQSEGFASEVGEVESSSRWTWRLHRHVWMEREGESQSERPVRKGPT